MFKIPKVECTLEFKELTAIRVLDEERVGVVTKDMGLKEQALRFTSMMARTWPRRNRRMVAWPTC